MADARRRAGSRRPAVAVLVSLVAHLTLLGVLAWRLTAQREFAEPPVMQVAIVRWPSARREPTPRPPEERREVPRSPVVQHAPPPQAVAARPSEQVAPPIPPAAPGPPDGQKVLRGLFACNQAALARASREERRRCEERAGALAANTAEPRLKLDKGFVDDSTLAPVLIRKPVNGCRVRVAGDKPRPMGDQKGVTTGVGCAFQF
jgi:hypothetical protein